MLCAIKSTFGAVSRFKTGTTSCSYSASDQIQADRF
jgi:hypothetical protein